MAERGYGANFLRGDGASSETFAAFASEINAIGPPNMVRNVIKFTHYQSTDGYMEAISSGIRDAGQVTININYSDTDYGTAKTDYESDSTRNYKVKNYAGDELLFAGLLINMQWGLPLEDKQTIDLTFEIDGKPTYTAGS